jgi:hypothetical protein
VDPKQYTYRCGRGIDDYLHCIFACVLGTYDEPNAPGTFQLRKGISPPVSFKYDSVFRKEWGWTEELHTKRYKAYQIYNRTLFQKLIVIHYLLGCIELGKMDFTDINTARIKGKLI